MFYKCFGNQTNNKDKSYKKNKYSFISIDKCLKIILDKHLRGLTKCTRKVGDRSNLKKYMCISYITATQIIICKSI